MISKENNRTVTQRNYFKTAPFIVLGLPIT